MCPIFKMLSLLSPGFSPLLKINLLLIWFLYYSGVQRFPAFIDLRILLGHMQCLCSNTAQSSGMHAGHANCTERLPRRSTHTCLPAVPGHRRSGAHSHACQSRVPAGAWVGPRRGAAGRCPGASLRPVAARNNRPATASGLLKLCTTFACMHTHLGHYSSQRKHKVFTSERRNG